MIGGHKLVVCPLCIAKKNPILNNETIFTNVRFVYHEIEETIDNAEEFVKKVIEEQGFKVIKLTGRLKRKDYSQFPFLPKNETVNGKPDFMCLGSDGFKFYVEVKTKGDGLRGEQIKWIIDNPLEIIIIYYLKQKN